MWNNRHRPLLLKLGYMRRVSMAAMRPNQQFHAE